MHEKDLIQVQGLAENIRAFLDNAVTLNYMLSINPDIKDTIRDADLDWDTRSGRYNALYNTGSDFSDISGNPLLCQMQSRYSFVELFFVQDSRGNQTARSFGELGQRADRWWFKDIALKQNYRPFLSNSYYSLTGAKPVASIFHPIMDNGSLLGIMGMDINFQRLQEFVESYMVLDDIYTVVTDMEGVVIAHPDSRIISELYNLKTMTRSVLKDADSSLNSAGYQELEEFPIDWPEEISEAVKRGIAGEQGFFENVKFNEGAQNVYYAPVSLRNISNGESNYVVLLIHDRSPIIHTRNIIFTVIIFFVALIIFVLYFLFHYRFNKQILHPLEVLIDSMKSLDIDTFEEINLDRDDEFSLLSGTYNRLRQKLLEANAELKGHIEMLKESEGGYKAFAEVGLALSTERNINKLMELILDEAARLTRADGGTLYLYDPEKNQLDFSILLNETMNTRLGGSSGDPVNLPPVPLEREGIPNKSNVSSYAAVTGEVINISNVYEAGENFDFSGVVSYDRINNYRSQSMLVIPMKNMSGDLIGVIQLINAREKDQKTVIPFSIFSERLLISLASQAAVALTNVQLNKDLQELFNDFIRSIAAAIDEKSAFTGGHIRRVVKLTMLIAEAVNNSDTGVYGDRHFSDEELEELRLAAWMHDIGKITTPESLMDKRSKLEGMQDRIEIIEYRYQMISSRGESSDSQYDHDLLEEELQFLKRCNKSEYLSDDGLERLQKISEKTYTFKDQTYPFLTDDELYNLSIRRGNLNPEERKKIEHHAEMTRRILGELTFPGHLSHVADYASMHHEKLDGSGYPLGLKGDGLPLQARIISVADIFEALTAKDRPYREPMKLSKAMMIMENMTTEGHIDGDVLKVFRMSGAMKLYATEELNQEQVDLDSPVPDDKID